MEKAADKLTSYIIKSGVIKEDEYAIYRYGLQIGMELLLCVITCVVVAIYIGKVWECILFLVIFFVQRGYMEGVHMKHFYACYILSCGVVIGALKLSEVALVPDNTIFFCTLLCLLLVQRFACKYSDRVSGEASLDYFVKKRKITMVVIIGITVLFYILHYFVGLRLIMYTEIMILISTLLKMISNKRSNEGTSF